MSTRKVDLNKLVDKLHDAQQTGDPEPCGGRQRAGRRGNRIPSGAWDGERPADHQGDQREADVEPVTVKQVIVQKAQVPCRPEQGENGRGHRQHEGAPTPPRARCEGQDQAQVGGRGQGQGVGCHHADLKQAVLALAWQKQGHAGSQRGRDAGQGVKLNGAPGGGA